MKRVFNYFVSIIVSMLSSQCLFYFFIDEYTGRIINPSVVSNIGMRVFVALIFYIILISLLERRFRRIHIDILAVVYFAMVIALSFLRRTAVEASINLNPLTIVEDFSRYFNHTFIILIGNLVVYFPLGVYVKYKLHWGTGKLALVFLVYIVTVEVCQKVVARGICDISDVILNVLGFVIGVTTFDFFRRKYQKAYS